MRWLLILLLFPSISFADVLVCSGWTKELPGTFDKNIKENKMATFTAFTGTKVLFSFDNCTVFLENK